MRLIRLERRRAKRKPRRSSPWSASPRRKRAAEVAPEVAAARAEAEAEPLAEEDLGDESEADDAEGEGEEGDEGPEGDAEN